MKEVDDGHACSFPAIVHLNFHCAVFFFLKKDNFRVLFVPNQSLGQIYMPLFVFLTIGREGDGVKEELNFAVMKYGVPQLREWLLAP